MRKLILSVLCVALFLVIGWIAVQATTQTQTAEATAETLALDQAGQISANMTAIVDCNATMLTDQATANQAEKSAAHMDQTAMSSQDQRDVATMERTGLENYATKLFSSHFLAVNIEILLNPAKAQTLVDHANGLALATTDTALAADTSQTQVTFDTNLVATNPPALNDEGGGLAYAKNASTVATVPNSKGLNSKGGGLCTAFPNNPFIHAIVMIATDANGSANNADIKVLI